ncbi:hypothetical protein MSG28_014841 [Choristoneura fumiferana]|uniref:Uncharacterized protein n=1 Tax=Choristoneura fumiferana TaxID=7141 RepID=A0ACC0JT28_CHOFU|nr:hypothetical protein MSG28_014841 [Choristoneura fumiferana]
MAASGPGPPGDGVVKNSALSFVALAHGTAGESSGTQDTSEQNASSNQADRVVPAGLKALYDACAALYPHQPNPLQVTTRLKYWLGGEDPLDYISMYWNPGVPEEQVPPHWHYVSFGLSDLHGDGRVHHRGGRGGGRVGLRAGADAAAGGRGGARRRCGLRRCCRHSRGTSSPPVSDIHRHLCNKFCAGDHVSWHAPLDASATRVRHLLVADDARLPRVSTPHGRVSFLQLVGCTSRELRAAQRSSGFDVLKMLQEDPSDTQQLQNKPKHRQELGPGHGGAPLRRHHQDHAGSINQLSKKSMSVNTGNPSCRRNARKTLYLDAIEIEAREYSSAERLIWKGPDRLLPTH